MLIECCSQERSFTKYYALLAQRFAYLSRSYQALFEDCFVKQYGVIHRCGRPAGSKRSTAATWRMTAMTRQTPCRCNRDASPFCIAPRLETNKLRHAAVQ